MKKYVLGIDQSTQGTKALLFDENGSLAGREDLAHRQIINEKGWVEHDPEEIYNNTLEAVKKLLKQKAINPSDIETLGISNQRETVMAWNRETGKPVYNAIVWQCARGQDICRRMEAKGCGSRIKESTGLPLSPYFSAAKLAWIMEHVPEAKILADKKMLCCGTMDSWLVFCLTGKKVFKTDYSNASRTQLFNIRTLKWDADICELFGIPVQSLPEVTDSNGRFGETDFGGILSRSIPIRAVMGDSHGALFGQGCTKEGMIKATYGTGSSVMMNIGKKPIFSSRVATSLAWSMDGTVDYVLEGNINYTGAVISWLKDDLQLIESPLETEELAYRANKEDKTYLVPAFSGLGAPYWNGAAKALICGMTRVTKKAEIVRAALDCIAYQVTDVIESMAKAADCTIQALRVDGGPTRNRYLMQFQSDVAEIPVEIPGIEELSGMGAAYAAGIAVGIYDKTQIFDAVQRKRFLPEMDRENRDIKYQGWKKAIDRTLV